MEKQYDVMMRITVLDESDIKPGQTVDELVLVSLDEAPFQVDSVTVRPSGEPSLMEQVIEAAESHDIPVRVINLDEVGLSESVNLFAN